MIEELDAELKEHKERESCVQLVSEGNGRACIYIYYQYQKFWLPMTISMLTVTDVFLTKGSFLLML